MDHGDNCTCTVCHFARLIAQLAEAWRQEISKHTIAAYAMGLLDDVPIEKIEAAVVEAIKTKRFMPSVSELRAMCDVDASPDSRAIRAWAVVDTAMSDHEFHTVIFDDPVITATIHNLGGWYRLSQITLRKDWDTWLRKDFERVYISLSHAELGDEQTQPSLGHFDRTNGYVSYLHRIETKLPWAIGFEAPAALEAPAQKTLAEIKKISGDGHDDQADDYE